MNSKYPYILKSRHGIYYFRVAIPERYSSLFPDNSKEIRRSLKTRDPKIALYRSRILHNHFLKQIDQNLNTLNCEHLLSNINSNIPVTLSDLRKAYISEMETKTRFDSRDNKSIKEYESSFLLAEEIIGDLKIKTLRIDHLEDFYSTLWVYPSNKKKRSQYRSLSASEIKNIHIPEEHLMSSRNIEKIFSRVRGLLNFALDKRYIKFNPARGVVLKKSKGSKKSKREMFSPNEIQLIFKGLQNEKNSYKFWIPVLAYYTGARLAELVQIIKEDIKFSKTHNCWYIDINDNYHPGVRFQKHLKNSNSIRKIPLHDDLIDIGFIEFIFNRTSIQVYKELCDLKHPADAFSKSFTRYLKSIDIHIPVRKTFHSFRHTFITSLINYKVSPLVLGTITGHSSPASFEGAPEIGNTYFKGISLNIKQDAINKLPSIQCLKYKA